MNRSQKGNTLKEQSLNPHHKRTLRRNHRRRNDQFTQMPLNPHSHLPKLTLTIHHHNLDLKHPNRHTHGRGHNLAISKSSHILISRIKLTSIIFIITTIIIININNNNKSSKITRMGTTNNKLGLGLRSIRMQTDRKQQQLGANRLLRMIMT